MFFRRIDNITTQLDSLGCDLDWKNLFYTMDEKFSRVVKMAFCKLYNDGVIYRDKKIVNWCPIIESVISDQVYLV